MSDIHPPSEVLPALLSCDFTMPDGRKCPRDKSARGYCDTHYQVLRRAGAFADIRKQSPAVDTLTVNANVKAIRRARRKLIKSAPVFVDHLLRASEVAAENGKSSAAEWALMHTRVVDPVTNTASTHSGTTINIGVKVSGSGESK